MLKRKSHRIVIIILLIVMAALLALPYIEGITLRRQLEKMPQQIADHSQGKVTASIVHYQNGWFHSTVQLKLEANVNSVATVFVNKSSQQLKPLPFLITLHISHGPLAHLQGSWLAARGAATGDVRFFSSDHKQAAMLPAIIAKPYHFQAVMHWNGSLTATVDAPKGNLFTNHSKHLNISADATRLVLSLPANFSSYSGSFLLKNLTIKNKLDDVNVPSVQYQFHKHRGPFGLWYGHSQLKIAKINSKNNIFAVDNIVFSADSRFDQHQKVVMAGQASIDKIKVLGNKVGSFKLLIHASNLSAKAMAALSAKLQNLSKSSTVVNQKVLLQQLQLPIAEAIAGGRVELKELTLTTPQGSIHADGNLSMATHQQITAATDPLQAIAAQSHGQLNIVIPTDLLDLFAASAGHLADLKLALSSGMLKKNGDNYVAKIHYQHQQLSINGKAGISLLPSSSATKGHQP